MANLNIIYRENSTLVQLVGLKNTRTLTPITDATVTLTMYAQDGTTELAGVVWPKTLTHDGAGTYYVDVFPTIPAASDYGKAVINVANPYDAQWEFTVDFRERKN